MTRSTRTAVVAASLAGVWFLVSACNRPREVTVYPIITFSPGDQPYAAAPAVYRVDVQKQDVMFWRPGVVESPERLKNCAVRDPQNWRCETNVAGDAGVVSMDRGQFEETVAATHFTAHGVSREIWEKTRRPHAKPVGVLVAPAADTPHCATAT